MSSSSATKKQEEVKLVVDGSNKELVNESSPLAPELSAKYGNNKDTYTDTATPNEATTNNNSNNNPNTTPIANNNNTTTFWDECCYCEEGWIMCLVFGCVDCNQCCCCCPPSYNYYIYMGWSLFMYVGFTFIYELYDVCSGSASRMEYIVYSFEMVFCDIPIMLIAWFDKAELLIITLITQIIATIGHCIITYIYFHHNDVSDGIQMLLFDVPFEVILCFCLIPFWKKKLPLWERREVRLPKYQTIN